MNITFACVKCDEPVGEIRMSKCETCGKYGIGGYICDECEHEETFDVIAGHEHKPVVVIDPNVRVRGNQTYTRLRDAGGPLVVGEPVICREVEDSVDWEGTVADIDEARGLVYLAVDWHSIRSAP